MKAEIGVTPFTSPEMPSTTEARRGKDLILTRASAEVTAPPMP